MTPIAFIKCPLCAWALEQKPLDPRINAGTLAGVFGPGIALQTAINQRSQDTERALETHLKTHTLVEWVKKVSDLQHENTLLRASSTLETSVGCMHKWTVLGAPRNPYPDAICEGGCGQTYAAVHAMASNGSPV